MYYLFLDESGDLGDYLQSPGASRHFVITILAVSDDHSRKAIEKAVFRTLKYKLQRKKNKRTKHLSELKATAADFSDKRYFYRQMISVPFLLYSVILDKAKFVNHLQLDPKRVYGFITNLVLKKLPLERATTRVILTLDRSMGSVRIREFNDHLFKQLETRIPPHVPLSINHHYSHEDKPLQAVDQFAWGIYRKYEVGDTQWYEAFQEKIAFEREYPDK